MFSTLSIFAFIGKLLNFEENINKIFKIVYKNNIIYNNNNNNIFVLFISSILTDQFFDFFGTKS